MYFSKTNVVGTNSSQGKKTIAKDGAHKKPFSRTTK
jgi:hypothetical protein